MCLSAAETMSLRLSTPKKTPQTCCQPSGHFLLGNLAVRKDKLKGLVMFWTVAGFQWGFDVKVQMFFLQNTTLTRLG